MEHTKLCKTCGTEKPLEMMVKKQGSYRHLCKECRNATARQRSKEDEEYREKERLRGKEKYQRRKVEHAKICKTYYNENLEWRKDLHIRKTYGGMTMDDKITMRDAQSNRCKICKIEFADDKSACIDHCHKTGKVRGLLCKKCNSGIGMFGDDPEKVRKAHEYLMSSMA